MIPRVSGSQQEMYTVADTGKTDVISITSDENSSMPTDTGFKSKTSDKKTSIYSNNEVVHEEADNKGENKTSKYDFSHFKSLSGAKMTRAAEAAQTAMDEVKFAIIRYNKFHKDEPIELDDSTFPDPSKYTKATKGSKDAAFTAYLRDVDKWKMLQLQNIEDQRTLTDTQKEIRAAKFGLSEEIEKSTDDLKSSIDEKGNEIKKEVDEKGNEINKTIKKEGVATRITIENTGANIIGKTFDKIDAATDKISGKIDDATDKILQSIKGESDITNKNIDEVRSAILKKLDTMPNKESIAKDIIKSSAKSAVKTAKKTIKSAVYALPPVALYDLIKKLFR